MSAGAPSCQGPIRLLALTAPPPPPSGRDRRHAVSSSYAMDAASNMRSCYYRSGFDFAVPLRHKWDFMSNFSSLAPWEREFFVTVKVGCLPTISYPPAAPAAGSGPSACVFGPASLTGGPRPAAVTPLRTSWSRWSLGNRVHIEGNEHVPSPPPPMSSLRELQTHP